MKRIFLLCTLLAVSIIQSKGQDNSNFWSIKAGVNFSNLTNFDYTSDFQTGFNAGALRAFSLSEQIPIYLQSGLSFEMKGAKNSLHVGDETYKSVMKTYALEIPLLINYGISISKKSTIHPFAGVYYSFALGGKIEANGESQNPYKKENILFDDRNEAINTRTLTRSDFGIRVGVDYKYTHYSIGIAYDAGLTNIYAKEFRDRNYEASTGTLSVNLGYYFE